jgi:hypothetical protein
MQQDACIQPCINNQAYFALTQLVNSKQHSHTFLSCKQQTQLHRVTIQHDMLCVLSCAADQVTRSVFEKGSPGFITEVRRQQQSHSKRHTAVAYKPLFCRC